MFVLYLVEIISFIAFMIPKIIWARQLVPPVLHLNVSFTSTCIGPPEPWGRTDLRAKLVVSVFEYHSLLSIIKLFLNFYVLYLSSFNIRVFLSCYVNRHLSLFHNECLNILRNATRIIKYGRWNFLMIT